MTTDHPNPSKPRRRWFQFSLRTLFWMTTVAGFYAWLFIAIKQPQMDEMSLMDIVEVVWLYAMLTVVTALMFWTKGKAIIGVALGFILANLALAAIQFSYFWDAGVAGYIMVMLFYGSHGAGICGGIDAFNRQHRDAGCTAIILTCVSFCALCFAIIFM